MVTERGRGGEENSGDLICLVTSEGGVVLSLTGGGKWRASRRSDKLTKRRRTRIDRGVRRSEQRETERVRVSVVTRAKRDAYEGRQGKSDGLQHRGHHGA